MLAIWLHQELRQSGWKCWPHQNILYNGRPLKATNCLFRVRHLLDIVWQSKDSLGRDMRQQDLSFWKFFVSCLWEMSPAVTFRKSHFFLKGVPLLSNCREWNRFSGILLKRNSTTFESTSSICYSYWFSYGGCQRSEPWKNLGLRQRKMFCNCKIFHSHFGCLCQT